MRYPVDPSQKEAFRQAILQVEPKYFSWSAKKQEHWRVTIPQPIQNQIERSLLQCLFSIEVQSDKEAKTIFDKFTPQQYLLFNSTMLFLRGIGENRVYLNECLPEKKTLLDFATVYDYDYQDF